MRNFGYYCINVATGRNFTITNIALKAARKDPQNNWDKQNKILYEIDEEGRKIRTPEEIGREQLTDSEKTEIDQIKKEVTKKAQKK